MIDFTHTIYLPCGGSASLFNNKDDGIGYRCNKCGVVVGRGEEQDFCQSEAEKYKVMEVLGGKGWDYLEGKQED